MSKHIEYFGGKTHGRMIVEDGQKEDVSFERDVWFDRDIDGRWLVGVSSLDPATGEATGAIVVKHPTVTAFIELLAELLAEPDQFSDEQFILGPDWDGKP